MPTGIYNREVRRTGKIITCSTCFIERYVAISTLKLGAKYCSNKCRGIAMRGKPSWNKGLSVSDPRVLKYTKSKVGQKRPTITGENNWNWRGDKISYSGVHQWIRRQLGRPLKCEHCGTNKKRRYNWANINHKYRRMLGDYISLCVPCHRKFDLQNN